MAAITTTRADVRKKAAKALGLYYSLTGTATSTGGNTVIPAAGIKDIAVDDEKFQFAWLRCVDQSEVRLVISTDVSAGTITVQRGFTGDTNGDVLELYLVLSFDEMNDAINDAVEDKFYIDRDVVTLVAEQTEYTLSNWIKDKGQIIRIRKRDVASGATEPREQEVPSVYPYDDSGEVKLVIPPLFEVENITYVVEARRYQTALTDDTTTVTIPERLLVAAAKWEMLKKVFQKMGPAAKRIFGQAMVLAERELAEQEQRHLPVDARRDYQSENIAAVAGAQESQVHWTW